MSGPRLDLLETTSTRDRVIEFPDGGWASFQMRPPGPGWTILADRERATVWTRRKPVLLMPRQRSRLDLRGGYARPTSIQPSDPPRKGGGNYGQIRSCQPRRPFERCPITPSFKRRHGRRRRGRDAICSWAAGEST